MLAFAILSMIMAIAGEIIHENMEKAADAIDKREMREIADTIFGKFLFEQTEHRDGDEGSVAVEYGQWAGLPQDRADRYEDYRWRLVKQQVVAAGVADTTKDEQPLVGSATDSTTGTPSSTSDTSSSSSSSSSADDKDAQKSNVQLVKFVLTVYHVDRPDEPLITLSRYLPPPDLGGATPTR
jgi:hypothetical protein